MKRRIWTGIASGIGILLLILDAKTGLHGAKEGIDLCLATVIPSLFPFFVLTGLLTSVLTGTSFGLLKGIGRLFRLPRGMETLLVIGLLGGYPTGARAVSQAYRDGVITQPQARRYLSVCNNPGPAFLFGICGPLFPEHWMAWALWALIILSAFITAYLTGPGESATEALRTGTVISLPRALESSVRTTAVVCGWVILFRVLMAYLDLWFLHSLSPTWKCVFTGLLELTNGCFMLPGVHSTGLRFLLSALLLVSGGTCVCMQTASVTDDLGISSYLRGKWIQTCVAALLALPICAYINGSYATALLTLCFTVTLGLLIFHIKNKIYSRKSRLRGV